MPKYITDFETVAAGVTDQAMGPTGAKGDTLMRLIITPALAAAGVVSIKDGTAGSSIPIYAGGAVTALPNLMPVTVELNMKSKAAGGWFVTTGANVSVVAVGAFT